MTFRAFIFVLMCVSIFPASANPSIDGAEERGAFAPLVRAFKGFDRFDENRDGYLDAAELAKIKRPELRKRIMDLDGDKDGRIAKAEIRARTVSLLQERTQALVQKLRQRFDTDQDGTVSLSEAKQAGAPANVLQALGRFDKNGDEKLAAEEVKAAERAFIGLTLKAKVARLQELVGQATPTGKPVREFLVFVLDTNGDGKASMQELTEFLDLALGKEATPYALGQITWAGQRASPPMTKPDFSSPKVGPSVAPPQPRLQVPPPQQPDSADQPPPAREVLLPGSPKTPEDYVERELREFLGDDDENDLLW
jgi:Ca2+-binding EF-hand superfamily protein